MCGCYSRMFPQVAQRPTQDLGNGSDKGDDASQHRQEAHEEAIRVEDTEEQSALIITGI